MLQSLLFETFRDAESEVNVAELGMVFPEKADYKPQLNGFPLSESSLRCDDLACHLAPMGASTNVEGLFRVIAMLQCSPMPPGMDRLYKR